MKKTVLIGCLIVLVMSIVSQARVWTVGAMAGGDVFCGQVGIVDGRAWFGVEATGSDVDEVDAYGLALVGTWDLVQDYILPLTFPFGVGHIDLTVTPYAGFSVGGISTESAGDERDEDVTAAGLVGVSWGSDKLRLRTEYRYNATERNWQQLSGGDDNTFLVGLQYRF